MFRAIVSGPPFQRGKDHDFPCPRCEGQVARPVVEAYEPSVVPFDQVFMGDFADGKRNRFVYVCETCHETWDTFGRPTNSYGLTRQWWVDQPDRYTESADGWNTPKDMPDEDTDVVPVHVKGPRHG